MISTPYSIEPILITLKLSFVTTIILIFIGLPIAYWLNFSKYKYKSFFEAIINLPLVLPPSVLGFYLLLTFNPDSNVGKFLKDFFNISFVFSFEAIILGSVIFSLPFMVQYLQTGMKNLPISLIEASYTLGKSKLETFFRVILPNIKNSLFAGIVISFAHTIGEFGLVLMIGGNIPGKTKVASIVIYEEVESMNYDAANFYSLIMLIICFSLLLSFYYINNKFLTKNV
ncbi:MAG: molybdate ABC transporter permease subunit [Candidatus Sericytochromatia bacterium]